MSAATDTLETGILNLILCNIAFTGIGDAAGLLPSAAAGNLYVSLHTADPGEAGTQSSSETAYTGYARVPVVRSPAGWAVVDAAATNAATVQFPACTAGSSTVTHVGIGTAASGAGKLLLRGTFNNPPSLAVSAGVAPKFDPGVINVTVA